MARLIVRKSPTAPTRLAALALAGALAGCGGGTDTLTVQDEPQRPDADVTDAPEASDPCRYTGALDPLPRPETLTQEDGDWFRTMVIAHHGEVLEVCDNLVKRPDLQQQLNALTPEARALVEEVIAFAQKAAQDQHKEIREAELALKADGQTTVPGEHAMHGMEGSIGKEAMRLFATADIDKAAALYSKAMQEHHNLMIKHAGDVLQDPDLHPAVKLSATNAKRGQSREVAMMAQEWDPRFAERGISAPATPDAPTPTSTPSAEPGGHDHHVGPPVSATSTASPAFTTSMGAPPVARGVTVTPSSAGPVYALS